jgi:hypothetical protein
MTVRHDHDTLGTDAICTEYSTPTFPELHISSMHDPDPGFLLANGVLNDASSLQTLAP